MIKKFKEHKGGKGPKGKDLTTFVRFGKLDHNNKQKGYGEDNFHSPPSSRGFYAMPKVAQEWFLLGSLSSYQPKVPFPKNPWDDYYHSETGERIKEGSPSEEEVEEYEKRRERVFKSIRREFKKTNGHIWHHLGSLCKPNEVLDRHNSWVKTEMSVWRKAFNKCSLSDRYQTADWVSKEDDKFSINDYGGITGYVSKDHYEVFFDEKV